MARAATSRLKVNPPLGRMPVLQFVPPSELAIDTSYQRSIETTESKALIRKIAQFWNWDLCQPLVVSRRRTEGGDVYFVIDGQHRLAAARLRSDIGQLPCVVVEYATASDEAASFVHLNQQRRPLNALDLFKAALASDDAEAKAIMAALDNADLALATHNNVAAWKPGQVAIIGGIQRAWRRDGAAVATEALQVLSTAFPNEVLRYAGTIFPGIMAVCVEEMRGDKQFPAASFASFTAKLGSMGQEGFRNAVLARCALQPDLGRVAVAIQLAREIRWPDRVETPPTESGPPHVPAPKRTLRFETDQPEAVGGDGKAWCAQCERRVTRGEAEGCKNRWCSLWAAG